ncbi:putative tensin-like C1 domain-containing phosphatase [Triplophysa rosa]|uniref:Tensin-like C1 domain-containing phosphatase n=1 Tax=Triplophysa rosa TaxID=992332 RepID=A0A9W7WU31_TRIRA|nr:putative tensin-like C1 domain-containing phosphatase [Triplophysa rosa]
MPSSKKAIKGKPRWLHLIHPPIWIHCELVPEEFEAVHSHTFRLKTFKKGKHCGVCKQTVNNEGLICRVCRIACHRKCEVKLTI